MTRTLSTGYRLFWSRLLRLSLPGGGRWAPLSWRRLLILPPLLLIFVAIQSVHWIGFLLDDLFFGGYRKIRIREPLFVIGIPRSGTSALQSVLAEDARFTSMRLWELVLAPSIVERKLWHALGTVDRALGRPLGRLVERGQRKSLGWMDSVHPASLFQPEEDYFLLLPAFACFLMVVPFPKHPEVWRLTRLDTWSIRDREALLDFYESLLKRHLYVVGRDRQLLSKNPSFTGWILALADRFPDARFVCCVRDPAEAVPSLLSSLESGARFFGYRMDSPCVRDRFLLMLQEFADCCVAADEALPLDRWKVVGLTEARRNLVGVVERMYETFGWVPDVEFRATVREHAGRASRYRSRHSYRAEAYGLSMESPSGGFERYIERFRLGLSSDSTPGVRPAPGGG